MPVVAQALNVNHASSSATMQFSYHLVMEHGRESPSYTYFGEHVSTIKSSPPTVEDLMYSVRGDLVDIVRKKKTIGLPTEFESKIRTYEVIQSQ